MSDRHPLGTARSYSRLADAARVANVSRDTIYREIERGALPVRHVGAPAPHRPGRLPSLATFEA